ncbi:MAG: cyclodeaminase/cyclohydrolase family protein [Tissierellia bacterium]|nr:cyclodeaminase/cyclohydrolase family protein [Tissierellia bacterium]
MNYKDIFELLLDEEDYTVGGGSSSAIAGAIACGLIGMVANLSKGKDYGYSDEKYNNLIKELNKMKEKLLQGCVDDNKAYLLIVNAYKLPKNNEKEKLKRINAIQKAGIEAAKVPMENACLNKRVYDIGQILLKHSNPACETDLQAGIDLSAMGIRAGKANVEVNLPLIRDEKIIRDFKKKMETL